MGSSPSAGKHVLEAGREAEGLCADQVNKIPKTKKETNAILLVLQGNRAIVEVGFEEEDRVLVHSCVLPIDQIWDLH